MNHDYRIEGIAITNETLWEVRDNKPDYGYVGMGTNLLFVFFLDERSAIDFMISQYPGTTGIRYMNAHRYEYVDVAQAARSHTLDAIMEKLNGTDSHNPKVNTLQDNDEGGMGESAESSRE